MDMCRQYTVDVVCRRLGYSEYGDPTKVPGHCSPRVLLFIAFTFLTFTFLLLGIVLTRLCSC